VAPVGCWKLGPTGLPWPDTEHRENRGARPLPVRIYAFIPESCVEGFRATFKSCAVVCQELNLYANLMDAVTYLGTTGSVPYIVGGPALQFTIQLRGTALPDLYFSIVHPGEGSLGPVLEGTGADLAVKGP
jgi:hypothetical protein